MAQAEIEEKYYSDLAFLRAQEQELNEVQATADRTVRHPSRLKYFLLFVLAIIADIIDFLQLTGIGIILVWLVNIFVTPILFLAGLGANSRIKAMNRFYAEIQRNIDGLTRKMMFYSRMYTRALRFSRRTGFLKKPLRKVGLGVARLRRSVRRNPVTKMGAALILDLIPLIELLPWQTIGVYLMYQDEKKTFKDTQQIVPEYLEAKIQEIAIAAEVASEARVTPVTEPENQEGQLEETKGLPLAA